MSQNQDAANCAAFLIGTLEGRARFHACRNTVADIDHAIDIFNYLIDALSVHSWADHTDRWLAEFKQEVTTLMHRRIKLHDNELPSY